MVVNKIKTLEEIFKSKINTNEDILGSICLQLIMVDIFKVLGLFPRSVSGDTFGKIVYAYSNDIMQMEEAVMEAIKLSKPKFDSDTNKSENFVDSKTEQLVNHGDISYETSHNIPKGTIIINISDFPITNKDNLLFENGTVNFLNVVGR